MLDSKILDRARRLIQLQFDQRRKIFQDEIAQIREKMLSGGVRSGAFLVKIHDTCTQEVAIRAKIVLENIVRAHTAVGSPFTETLAADIKEEGSHFIEKITEEVGKKMASEMHFMEREAKDLNLSSAKHVATQELNVEADLYVDSLAAEPQNLESVNNAETQNMIKLFISHSSKDQELVEKLIELVKNALRLSSSEIRCTTIDGYRLRGGANTNEQLKSEVSGTKAFIGVISYAAIDSMYVLFELGARWGANKHLLPLLPPGVSSDILKSPLSGLNALSCDSASQLHQLVEDIANELEIKREKPQAYQRYIDAIRTIPPSEDKNSSVDNKLDSEIPIQELLVMNILAAKNEQSEAAILDYLKEKGMSNLDYHAAISSLTGKKFIRQTNTSPVSYNIFPIGYQWAMQNKNLFDQLNAEVLSDEANKMLLKAAQRDGVIIKAHNMRERCIQINGENIISSQDPRTVAKWESALEELEENDFIKDKGHKGEVFGVTSKGYNYADKIK